MPRRGERSCARATLCYCADIVFAQTVTLLINWLIYGMVFQASPPECFIIDEGLIGATLIKPAASDNNNNGSLEIITNKTAIINAYIHTPGLKVQYKNIKAALLRHTKGISSSHAPKLVTRLIDFPDVDLGYERSYSWRFHINSDAVLLEPGERLLVSDLLALKIEMEMSWNSVWSLRSGIFDTVTITCPVNPAKRINNTPVGCFVTS